MTQKFPKIWFQNLTSSQTIPQLNNICRLIMRIVDSFENELDSKLFK
jgi:hypothetical protein